MSSATAERTGRASRLRAAFRAGPLAVRDFRLFGIGQLTSTAGDFCYAVALPWLVLSGHGGTVLLGTVLACYGVPRTILIPFGGVLVDRLSARTVMLIADSLRCVLVAVFALVAARGLVSIAFLGPVAALIGAGEGAFLPASAAIMPSLLPVDSLQEGNGLSAAMIQVGSLVGPVLGGILVGIGTKGTTDGPAIAFAVDAATFAVSAGALALMRTCPYGSQAAAATEQSTPAGTTPQANTVPGLAEAAAASAAVQADGTAEASATPLAAEAAALADAAGADSGSVQDRAGAAVPAGGTTVWKLLKSSRELQLILVIAVLANFVIAGAFEVALPTLSHARFGPTGYGALIACFGVGSLAGTLTAARVKGPNRPAIGGCAAYVAAGAALALVPYLGGLPGAAAAAAVFGAAGYYGNIVIITLLQRWAPPHLLGRVMSLVMLAAIGAFPLSVALSGVIVHNIGPAPFFPAAGAMLALTALAATAQRQFRNFGARDEAPPDAAPDQAAVVTAR